jgi:iron complex outermembrane receptor protein
MKRLGSRLQVQASVLALLTAAAVSQSANAQATSGGADATAAGAVSEIVVTGTNIRGVAPVGSNLMSVNAQQIEKTDAQTIQQILREVPAVTGIAATPQGGNPGNSFYAPTIHDLGSSSSNSTLVIVDGHRISPGSQQQTLTDPNIIPPIALERVEVLAEGASSIYGSDAVAGVVNFITRKKYDGLMLTGQTGFGSHYRTYSGGAIWGTHWDSGNVFLAYDYSNRSSLAYADREYLNRNHIAQGGTNFGTFFCAPAAIRPAGFTTIFPSPTSTTPIANVAANSPCQNTLVGDILPNEIRHNGMLKIRQDVNPNLDVGLDVVLSNVTNIQKMSRGTLTATVFQTGAQANPYYVNPPGVAATSQSVLWNADQLLGPGAKAYNNNSDFYISGTANYKLPHDWRLSGLLVWGGEESSVGNSGLLCVSCANLALNGTTNSGGSLTTPSIPGTNTFVTQTLTGANALDVWNPPGSNRTSAATLAQLTDTINSSVWYYNMGQARIGLDGELFKLPGGPVKLALGAEYVFYSVDMNKTFPNNTGPSSTGSSQFLLYLQRSVESANAEVLIPIIGHDNSLPFVKSFDISISGRYDNYSQIGSTMNPHVSGDWEIADGIKLRANYSTSFVAPQLTSVGDRSRGGLTSFSTYMVSNTTLIVPTAKFPAAAAVPGAACTLTSCTISSTINGIVYNSGPADPQPGKGRSWSIGGDFAPKFIPGFRAGLTFFNTELINQITGGNASYAINSSALTNNLQFFPGGATQAQINAAVGSFPQASAIPSTVYYILSVRQQNILNLTIQGIDADFNYRHSFFGDSTLRLGGSVTYFTKFDQNILGGPTFSVLNTTGFNSTFPSIQTQGRANVGLDFGNLTADAFVNYVGSYKNWSATSVTPVVTANGFPASGGDTVAATTTLDLNLTYKLNRFTKGGTQLYVDVTNAFDARPSFYNSANGYDAYAGNIIGRVVSVGFRTKF